MLLIVAAAVLALAEPVRAAPQAADAAPAEPKPLKVCTMENVGGSLMRKKVCYVKKPKVEAKAPRQEDAAAF